MERPNAGASAKRHRLGDRRAQHRQPVASSHVGQHRPRVLAATVIQGGSYPEDLKARVEDGLHVREVSRSCPTPRWLDISPDHRMITPWGAGVRALRVNTPSEGEQSKDHVIVVAQGLQHRAQHKLPTGPRQQLRLRTRQLQ